MIEHLLRTSEQQALNNEPLKAAIDCNENTNGTPAAVHSYIPGIPDLDAGNLPKKAPGKSGTDKGMEATKADSTTKNPDNYYTLMEHIMAKVEAEEYNIEPDMRRRIKDDVIRTLEREASLLRSDHGHTKSKGKMREKPLKVIEMANDEADTGEQPRMEQAGGFLSGAEPGPFPSDFGAQFRCFDPNHTSMGSFHKRIEGYQQWPTKAPTPAMSRVHTPDIKTIELFLDSREDPWNHLHLLLDALLTDKPKDAEVNGWLPFWTSGASMRAFHRIPPLNPLKAPLLSWRCCTSMLITEKSHDLESIASSQDLAALTDSTDTDTFVSARSEFGDVVLDTSFCRLEDEEKHVLLEILDGPGCRDAAGKDDPRLGVANFHQYMDGLLDGSLAS